MLSAMAVFPSLIDALVKGSSPAFKATGDPQHKYIHDSQNVGENVEILLGRLSALLSHFDRQKIKINLKSGRLPNKLNQWAMEARALKRVGNYPLKESAKCDELVEIGIRLITHLEKCPFKDEMMHDGPTPVIIWKPESSSEKPSRRLEEKYEVEESRLEGKKMEHEHPGTDQPFSTLSGDDVRQDQYGGTSAGASSTEETEPTSSNVLPVFDKYVDEIMDYLFENEGYNCVGIVGCHGAGKTTVLKKLYNRLLSGGEVDHIIWIEYYPEKEEKVVEKLQNEIMEQLEISHEASSSSIKNANRISAFLCDKRYVLLMDNVSIYIDLEDLGVKQNHKYKKVVVCSSEKNVVLSMTEKKVDIRGLTESEALDLFENECGKLYGRKREIAKRIIECCEGIPLLIHLVAVELKDKNDGFTWNNFLRSLYSTHKYPELINLGPYAKVYEMKYEGLEAYAKKCLLYCALFPLHHKIKIDYLVECWIAERILFDGKVRVNRMVGLDVLNKLTPFLLQWCSGKKYVVMPPISRKVALELDYPDEEKSVNWVPSEDRNPDEADWATVTRMSLIGCKMELPDSPRCPNICILLLQSLKQEAGRLPDSFFAHMKSLKVLDLNNSEITTLPGSIGNLVNLKNLYLNGCIGIVALPPEAARLERLQFLDISGTSISTLPEVIKCMVNLRCLRASHKVIIPPGIISSLINLEELSIVTDFDFQGENGIAVAEILAKELASLQHLNTLHFDFPNASSFETFVTNSKALEKKKTYWGTETFPSFKIRVGHETRRRSQEPEFSGMLGERWLRYSTNEEFSQPCPDLLKQTSALEIIGHDGLKSFTGSKFDLDQMKVCVVERCNRLENIVDGYIARENQESLLPKLEKLYLYDLEMLKCIWDGPVPRKSLVNLTTITVDGCHGLTKIFDPAWAQSLKKLEYLKVENCGQISKIIEGSGEIYEDVELLENLKRIELSNLPKLECICENTSSISCKSMESIIVKRCSKLRYLSLAYTNATRLPSIHCEESWWNTIASNDQPKLRVCFFKEESVEAGAQSRREEASTSASGSSKAIDEVTSDVLSQEGEDEMMYDRPTPAIIPKPESSSEKPSRRLEEIYEVEESHLEGKKMEHEHPGTDQPFTTLSGDDVQQDQYGGTSAGASSTEVQVVDEMSAWTYTEKHSIEEQEVELQKENVAAIPVENQGSEPTSTSEITLVLDAVVPKTPSNMAISESGFISEQQRKIQEVDEPRTSTNATKLPSIHSEESCWNTLTSDDQLECKDSFIEKESIEGGAQSRREEASTSASGRHEMMPIGETKDPPEETSRHLDDQSVDDIVFGRVGESELGITFRILLVGRNMPELQISSMSSTQTQEETDFGLRPDMDNYHFFSTREAALELKENSGIVIRNGKEMPMAEEWRRARVVNLIERKAVPISNEEAPNCPNLLILFLQRNSRLTRIPPSFFHEMPRLNFLDLSDTRIKALPSSLFKLSNLQVLLLRSCVCLDTLPAEVGKLTNLEVLDLLGTDLPDLPKEVRALTKLRHLQMSFHQPDYRTSESELVSSRSISELQDLQGLSISVHPKDQHWPRIIGDVIEQVAKLKKLSYLQFYFPSVEALVQFSKRSLSWREKRLRRFSFVVGLNIKRIISRVPEEVEREYEKYDQCLRFLNSSEQPQLMEEILKSVTAFYLDHHLEIQSLSEFGVSTFAELKFCVLRECPNMKVVNVSFFPKLEYLGLHYLWNLERIWEDDPTLRSYQALKYLEISTCGKLKYVASHSVFQCLSNLETFIVEDCESLTSIVEGAAADPAPLLPQLKKLRLRHLPELVALGEDLSPSEDVIDVECCPKFKKPKRNLWALVCNVLDCHIISDLFL